MYPFFTDTVKALWPSFEVEMVKFTWQFVTSLISSRTLLTLSKWFMLAIVHEDKKRAALWMSVLAADYQRRGIVLNISAYRSARFSVR